MRQRFIVLGAVLAALLNVPATASPRAELAGLRAGVDYAEGEISVAFAPDLPREKAEALALMMGGTLGEKARSSNSYRVRLGHGADMITALERFEADSRVLWAAPIAIYYPHRPPNDARYDEQWPLLNTGQTGGTVDADIDAHRAWAITEGDSGVTIAIVDTGVDYNHPDLDGGRYAGGYDFVSNDANPMDIDGHGTFVAAIATADTDNGVGIAGISQDSAYQALRVCGPFGCFAHDVADAIEWAVDNGADVINLSLGGPAPAPQIEAALEYAYSNDVVTVCSAGNSNCGNVSYPAAYPECIAVANTDHDDQRGMLSSCGPEVDVAAPGTDVLSAYQGDYLVASGTSAAAPHVSGLVALLVAERGTQEVETVRSLIEQTADGSGVNNEVGHGRINAERALSTWAEPSPVLALGVYTPYYCDPYALPSVNDSAHQFCVDAGFETYSDFNLEGPQGGTHTWWNGSRWATSGNNSVCYIRDLECKLPVEVTATDCELCFPPRTYCVTGSTTGGELPVTPYWRIDNGAWVPASPAGEGPWTKQYTVADPDFTFSFRVKDAAGSWSNTVIQGCYD